MHRTLFLSLGRVYVGVYFYLCGVEKLFLIILWCKKNHDSDLIADEEICIWVDHLLLCYYKLELISIVSNKLQRVKDMHKVAYSRIKIEWLGFRN